MATLTPDALLAPAPHQFLACNAAGALSILLWSLCCSAVMFTVLRASGLLRVSEDEELQGETSAAGQQVPSIETTST